MRIGTSYFGSRAVQHVKEDMVSLKESGFTDVLHTLSEEDMEYYLDSVKDIVAVSHAQGLNVYVSPWSVANVFGGQALSKFVAYHPEDCQIGSDGKVYPTACLNSPRLFELLKRWVDAAHYVGADVVFWDEPHWLLYETGLFEMDRTTWACRCLRCREQFLGFAGYEMPLEQTEEVFSFKHAATLRLVIQLSDYAKSLGLKVAVCLLPILKNDVDRKHWEEIISHSSIDIFATDPYTVLGETGLDDHYLLGAEKFVGHYSNEVLDLCEQHGKEGQIWVQNFMIPKEKEHEISIAFRAAYDAGIRNIFTWGFKGSQNMSHLRCERPDAAWEQFLTSMHQVLVSPSK
jgi:hypothetical protein